MAVIVNKENDKNNELTRRINADLREKAFANSGTDEKKNDPDFAEDAEYMRDLKKTGKFGWVWILLVMLGLVILVGVGVSLNSK